ncbi:hypothetical protein [Saccharicrinis aurantiacus]|uniref:hypothetical protein n=1 Tax=Saccharicrinis aurantiacus TaxID=1849719 RepID=UPI00094F7BF4|nr:hypothetical protein [Saccharicrinis aurantiacus]
MTKILRLKSWQTFGLIIILPIIFIILGAILSIITGIKASVILLSFIAAITMMISYYGWIWTAGIAMYKQGITYSKRKLNVFKLLFVLALFFSLFIIPILKTALSVESLYLIQIIGLVPLVSFFYCIYFTAKSIRNIEMQRKIRTSYMFLDFVLIWILPIGIWIIQPRVNEILSNKEEKAL